jgi:Protein kinase domain/PEGA domain
MVTSDARGADGGDPRDPLLGQVFLDRYRLVRKLEARRGGGVYFAQHLLADRAVAVEVLEADQARPTVIDQFLEDARTVARIGHENVVEIFNGGRSAPGGVFLAMEVLEGPTLAHVLANEPPLLWDRAQGIALQIAAALGAVHRHGIVHGELGPGNVLLVPRNGRREFVKVLDFGVGRIRAGASDEALDYLAPEQVAGGTIDHRADVYALGCLVYHLVTGRAPFAPERRAEAEPADDAPAPPTSRRPAGTLPAELDPVLLRALQKDPERRWPDVAAFADALSRCRLTRRQSVRVEALAAAEKSGKTDAFELDARARRRRAALLSVAAAVVIAIAGVRVITTAPGHVQITTVPADATLTFNGLPVAARSPVVLEATPGRYALAVSRPGYVTAERTVEVHARSTVAVPVELAPEPNAAASAAVAPPAGAAAAPEPAPSAIAEPAAAPAPLPAREP